MGPPISVVVERGAVVEARHRVHAAAVRDGELVDAAGEARLVAHMRSAAKPLQALPLALEVPELPDEELAIACASHQASEEQLAAVARLLARSDSTEADLECGEERGSKLRHNCSGKHAGMLLRAKQHRWPLPGYSRPEHPLQLELLELVAEATGVRSEDIRTAPDGCGVVSYGVPLAAMASAFARLARGELPGSIRVAEAMCTRPDLVGGPTFADTALMRALHGTVAKRGAEGVLCAAHRDGTGVAVKVEDGANRAAGPALAHFLGLDELAEAPVFNSRGERVGRILATR